MAATNHQSCSNQEYDTGVSVWKLHWSKNTERCQARGTKA